MTIATVITRGYGSFGDIAGIVLLGYEPARAAPAQVVTTGAGGELSRRRWLEWRDGQARKRRKARPPIILPPKQVPVVSPIIAPIPALPPILDLSPMFQRLSANIQAAREQRAILEAAEQAMLDDEEALALLLEEL